MSGYCYEIVGILVALVIVFITYFKWSFKYWERKGVPGIPPQIPFGNRENPFNRKQSDNEMFRSFYKYFKSKGHPYGGVYFFAVPGFIVVNPDTIRYIMAKDFNYFINRGTFYDEEHDPINAHLFNLEGQAWRSMRMKLTPTFTSGKMKMMFGTLLTCGDQMMSYINSTATKGDPLDIKNILTCFTTDVIGSCAFGIDCNGFTDKDSEFIKKGREIFAMTLWRKMRFFLIVSFPELCKKLRIPLFENRITQFYSDVVRDTVKYREEKSVKRSDFLQLLLELKKSPSNKNGLTMMQITAQSFVFFVAGFETSSTTMNFCLYELARNQDVQDKLRKEIKEVLKRYDEKLTYDAVMEMKYLGQVLDETLRKYPPVPVLFRQCVKDYKIPDTDITIAKDTRIFIPVQALHNDPDHYPEPDNFDPERFNDKNKGNRHPFLHLPFGEGPRNCIGLRFGLMQSRVGLTLILNNYKVKLNPKTPVPLQMNPESFLLAPKSNIYLDVTKIS